MNVCDLNTGLDQMTRAMSDLTDRWAETRTVWQDTAAERFEETHLTPLPAQIKLLVTALNELKASVHEAQRELEDRVDNG